MANINWSHPIADYHRDFISDASMHEYSHFLEMISAHYDENNSKISEPFSLPVYDQRRETAQHEYDAQLEYEQEKIDLCDKINNNSRSKLFPAYFKAPKAYPRFSQWSRSKQEFVVNKMMKWSVSGVPQNASGRDQLELNDFMSLIQAMKSEQEEFMKFVKQVNEKALYEYNFLSARNKYYLKDCLAQAYTRVRSYPRYYTELRKISLLTTPKFSQMLILKAVGEPLDLGCVPVCCIPRMTQPVNLKRFCANLRNFFPPGNFFPRLPNKKQLEQADGRYLYKLSVSNDPNANDLCRAMPVDFVVTPSVLKLLLKKALALPGFLGWEIPIRVSSVDSHASCSPRKVIFLDKPLPPRDLTFLQAKKKVHKRSVRLLTCKRVDENCPDYSVWSDERIDKLNLEKNRKSTRETDGVGVSEDKARDNADDHHFPAPSSNSVDLSDHFSSSDNDEADDDDGDDDGDEGNLQMDVDEAQFDEPRQNDTDNVDTSSEDAINSTVSTQSVNERTSKEAVSDGFSQKTDDVLINGESRSSNVDSADTSGQRSEIPQVRNGFGLGFKQPFPGSAVNYRFWKLGAHGLLIRTHTHGMLESPVLKKLIVYTVHAKLAHQASYGVEVMTSEELVDQWVDCLLRPGSRILRVYVHPKTRLVACVQELSLQQLENDLLKYQSGFTPKMALAILDAIISSLTALNPGKYILKSNKDDRTTVSLMCAEGQSEAVGRVEWFDLWSSYPKTPSLSRLAEAPWIPIDTTVLTPYNIKFGRVPGLFNYKCGSHRSGERKRGGNKKTAARTVPETAALNCSKARARNKTSSNRKSGKRGNKRGR